MPKLIDYGTVVETLAGQGLKALYYNSGTFGFADDRNVQYVGWIGADDPTLRPAVRDVAIRVAEPYPETLARLVRRFWVDQTAGAVWFTPGSHWAYEIQDGGEHFMPELLRSQGIDPAGLKDLNQGAAIEFSRDEAGAFEGFLRDVLRGAKYTDYGLVFPTSPVSGLVHHHVQIWWRVKDLRLLQGLRDAPAIAL